MHGGVAAHVRQLGSELLHQWGECHVEEDVACFGVIDDETYLLGERRGFTVCSTAPLQVTPK